MFLEEQELIKCAIKNILEEKIGSEVPNFFWMVDLPEQAHAPGERIRVGLTTLTMAEYFRDMSFRRQQGIGHRDFVSS